MELLITYSFICCNIYFPCQRWYEECQWMMNSTESQYLLCPFVYRDTKLEYLPLKWVHAFMHVWSFYLLLYCLYCTRVLVYWWILLYHMLMFWLLGYSFYMWLFPVPTELYCSHAHGLAVNGIRHVLASGSNILKLYTFYALIIHHNIIMVAS